MTTKKTKKYADGGYVEPSTAKAMAAKVPDLRKGQKVRAGAALKGAVWAKNKLTAPTSGYANGGSVRASLPVTNNIALTPVEKARAGAALKGAVWAKRKLAPPSGQTTLPVPPAPGYAKGGAVKKKTVKK